jgi:hypothetical protein
MKENDLTLDDIADGLEAIASYVQSSYDESERSYIAEDIMSYSQELANSSLINMNDKIEYVADSLYVLKLGWEKGYYDDPKIFAQALINHVKDLRSEAKSI